MTIRWKRSTDDGFVESHDGRWRITPLYWGCTRPQLFELFRDGKRVFLYERDQALTFDEALARQLVDRFDERYRRVVLHSIEESS